MNKQDRLLLIKQAVNKVQNNHTNLDIERLALSIVKSETMKVDNEKSTFNELDFN